VAEHPGNPTEDLGAHLGGESVALFRLVAPGSGAPGWRATDGRLTVGSHPGNDVVLSC